MHKGEALPILAPDTLMRDGLLVMTAKGFAIAAVVEAGTLLGIITDGNLRRNLDGLLDHRAADVATCNPKTVPADTLASEALRIMNEFKISALFVTDEAGDVVGLIHIHDCLRAGVA